VAQRRNQRSAGLRLGEDVVTDNSYLLVTLDSCRYDAFVQADAPNMKTLGTLHRAMAPGYFTYASHAAMLMGFTPGIAGTQTPFLNPKFGKIFKLAGAAFPGKGTEHVAVSGRNIVHGLRELGYMTFGTSGNEWFNPHVPSGQHLGLEFDRFFFCSQPQALVEQSAWLLDMLGSCNQPRFGFVNINETHVPYWYPGAPWLRDETHASRSQATMTRSSAAGGKSLASSTWTDCCSHCWRPLRERTRSYVPTMAIAGVRMGCGSMESGTKKSVKCHS
jgi:hypothetical protein